MRALEQKELAAINISCDEPGAEVMLDGKRWFVGPHTERRIVLPGAHFVTATKSGYYTVVKSVAMFAGKEVSGVLEMSVDTVVARRFWPVGRPWAVVGVGAAFTLLGGVL